MNKIKFFSYQEENGRGPGITRDTRVVVDETRGLGRGPGIKFGSYRQQKPQNNLNMVNIHFRKINKNMEIWSVNLRGLARKG